MTGLNTNLFLLVEQAPNNRLHRQRTIEQFFMAEAARKDRNMLPLGMIDSRMQTLAAFLAIGKMLD